MVCGSLVQILVVRLHCVLQQMTHECAGVLYLAHGPTLMTGLASRDVFLNMLAKSEQYARQVFLPHLMNGAGNYAASAQLMRHNVLRHVHSW
jgi:hypothetical protein